MIKYRDKSGQIHEIQDGDLFVTKDKNGKDVFAGDRVKSDTCIGFHEGIVTYRPDFSDYVVVKDGFDVDEGYGNFGCKSKDIELIEEKEDD